MADKPEPFAIFLPFPGGGLCARPLIGEALMTRLWQAINNIDNRVYLNQVYPKSWRTQQAWVEKADDEHNIIFFIKYQDEYIGGMGLHHIDYIHGTAVTGTLIWEPQFRNRGIARLAKLVLLEYAFNTLNLRQVYSKVIAYNKRSAAYSDKCGYRYVATLPRRLRFGEDLVDEITLLAERETWLPCCQAFQVEHQGCEGLYRTRQEIVEDDAAVHRKKKEG